MFTLLNSKFWFYSGWVIVMFVLSVALWKDLKNSSTTLLCLYMNRVCVRVCMFAYVCICAYVKEMRGLILVRSVGPGGAAPPWCIVCRQIGATATTAAPGLNKIWMSKHNCLQHRTPPASFIPALHRPCHVPAGKHTHWYWHEYANWCTGYVCGHAAGHAAIRARTRHFSAHLFNFVLSCMGVCGWVWVLMWEFLWCVIIHISLFPI